METIWHPGRLGSKPGQAITLRPASISQRLIALGDFSCIGIFSQESERSIQEEKLPQSPLPANEIRLRNLNNVRLSGFNSANNLAHA